MKQLLTLILLTISFSTFAQKKYYNTVVNSYQGNSSSELIELVKGTTILNYDFTDINGEKFSTDESKKPIYLAVVSSRSAPFWTGVKALNKIMENNNDKLDVVFLFVDDVEHVKKIAPRINKNIKLVAPGAGDKKILGDVDISGFVHKLKDNPSGYLINKDKEIVTVIKGSAIPNKTTTLDQAVEKNLVSFNKTLSSVIALN